MPSSYDPRGSLSAGIRLGWATIVVGYLLVLLLAGTLSLVPFLEHGKAGLVLSFVLIAAPWLALVGWVVFHLRQGSTRTAAGVGLSVVTMAAAALLLVAACHGILAVILG